MEYTRNSERHRYAFTIERNDAPHPVSARVLNHLAGNGLSSFVPFTHGAGAVVTPGHGTEIGTANLQIFDLRSTSSLFSSFPSTFQVRLTQT